MDAMKDFGPDRGADGGDADAVPNIAAELVSPDQDRLPAEIGQDERRMQVRAYHSWAGMLDGRDFPSIEDLSPESDPDFGPYSVLLDFTEGVENPGIAFLGEKLAEECGVDHDITGLEQVPLRSLLTRLTDHYLQIFANQAPIGFEAEFVNQRGETILYRGIMLPFSSNDETIDFIYGVINWKVVEVPKEQDFAPPQRAPLRLDQPVADDDDDEEGAGFGGIPRPLFGKKRVELPREAAGEPEQVEAAQEDVPAVGEPPKDLSAAEMQEPAFGLSSLEIGLSLPGEDEMELADWLAEARECADAAKGSEDRSRKALYEAIGRAYDFSLAAAEAPEDYAELIRDAGLKPQDRAPMTPLVKLVFGADYDKTRLTEYATVLGHAQRLELGRGALASFLSAAEGGLKGVIAAERGIRREDSGKHAETREGPHPALARKLREMPLQPFDALPPEGDEFTLVLARRLPNGEIAMLGEVPSDVSLLERAARKLVG